MTTTINERPNLGHLKPVKIHSKSEEDDKKGFYMLMVSGMPVQALSNNRYVVNSAQVEMLEQKRIRYEKID
ncbi:MAG: hypothetical protein ACR2IS_10050 [Nitrososphaeraceae archaeon]